MNEQREREYREYVHARSDALMRTAYLLTGNRADAEDLMQTTLVKTYQAWSRIEHRGAVDSYVRRTMVNAQTSWWRRRRLHFTPLDDVGNEHSRYDAPRDDAEDQAMSDTVWATLATLPPRQRAAVVLRYYEDLSEAETARVMGVSVGTVKSTTARALSRLRDSATLRDLTELAP